ncbi:MAG: hypothetical protein NVS3B16_04780 [Vulcanimicrobiaceae bacterium]
MSVEAAGTVVTGATGPVEGPFSTVLPLSPQAAKESAAAIAASAGRTDGRKGILQMTRARAKSSATGILYSRYKQLVKNQMYLTAKCYLRNENLVSFIFVRSDRNSHRGIVATGDRA